MYFALTSLSTVGFGDFYPLTNFERLLTAFVLLIGIMLFSYVLGELRFMMKRIRIMDSEIENIEQLERFFTLLRKFNYGNQISSNLQLVIREFLFKKWTYDKNNFLQTELDNIMMNQLP